MQAASLYTSIVLESTSFVTPLRDLTSEVEKSSRKMEREQNRLARSAERLLSSVDPVYAAQSRYNRAVAEAERLHKAGTISAEQLAQVEQRHRQAIDAATEALKRQNGVSAQSQYRMRLLGYQISDVGVQLAGGQSPFLILAQQGPQVVNALDGVQGRIGKVATFLSGPWGAALLAGGSMLGMFASKMLESRNVTEEHERASKTLKEAIEELDRVSGMHNKTLERQIQLGREALEDKRKQIEENIKLAKSYIAVAEAQMAAPTSKGGQEINAGMRALIEQSRKRLEELEADLGKVDRSIRGSQAALIKQEVDERLDAMTKARNDYDRAVKALDAQLAAGEITDREHGEAYEKLTRDYKEQTKAIQEASRKRVSTVDKELNAINSLISGFLTERTAMETYAERLDLLDKGLKRNRLSADELALAGQRVRAAWLDDLGLEKIEASIAKFDPNKLIKKSLPTFDARELQRLEGQRQITAELERSAERARQLDQTAMQFAATMTSGFEDAIFAGKGLRSVFTGLLEDMGRMVIRLTVMEPLARSFADALKGSGGLGGGGGGASLR